MEITADPTTGTVELTVRGRWSKRLAMDVSAAICTCLARTSAGIIVSLHQLADPAGASIPLWAAIRRTALAQQPPVHVVILDPQLRHSGSAWHPPVFATMPEARAAVVGPPPSADLRKAWQPALPAPRRR